MMDTNNQHSAIDRGFAIDLLIGIVVAASFAAFSVTVFQLDSVAPPPLVIPPGRTVSM